MTASEPETAADRVAEMHADSPQPERDETAWQRVAMLAKRNELDVREAKYQSLVKQYGSNRHAKRRARAEVRKRAKTK